MWRRIRSCTEMGTGFINVEIDVESMNSFRKAEKAPVGPGHARSSTPHSAVHLRPDHPPPEPRGVSAPC